MSPPFLRECLALAAPLPPLRFAQRALAAAESLARVAADIDRLPERRADEREVEPLIPKIELSRLSSVSI